VKNLFIYVAFFIFFFLKIKKKMIHFLYILIFNILTIWIVVKGKTTDDCENLNIFLNRNLSTDCCDGTSIECDNNGNFNILKL